MLLTDVINGLDILADQLEQEAKKTTVYEVELAPLDSEHFQQPQPAIQEEAYTVLSAVGN